MELETTKNIVQHFFTPGHGYVITSVALLAETGIVNLISPYSLLGTGDHIFNMKGYAYLEHDCDAGIIQHTMDFLKLDYETTSFSDEELEEMFVERYGYYNGFKRDKNHYHPRLIIPDYSVKPMHPDLIEYLRTVYRKNLTENWYL